MTCVFVGVSDPRRTEISPPPGHQDFLAVYLKALGAVLIGEGATISGTIRESSNLLNADTANS